LERRIVKKFYAVVNDLIGGWDVSMNDKPVSEHVETTDIGRLGWRERTIGSFMDEETAKAVARSLNLMQYCACGEGTMEGMHKQRDHPGTWLLESQ
jgi:hypothetical protein